MWVGRVTSWRNICPERKVVNSLFGFLLGQTLKSPTTSVVFSRLMDSFKMWAALKGGSSCERYIVMISRSVSYTHLTLPTKA